MIINNLVVKLFWRFTLTTFDDSECSWQKLKQVDCENLTTETTQYASSTSRETSFTTTIKPLGVLSTESIQDIDETKSATSSWKQPSHNLEEIDESQSQTNVLISTKQGEKNNPISGPLDSIIKQLQLVNTGEINVNFRLR